MRLSRTNTVLYCDRWEETVRFYRDLIKLPMLMEKGWFVEFRLTDSSCLSVADAARTSIHSAGGDGITLSWQVENIDAVHRRMRSTGIAASPFTVRWGARAFDVVDPEGNRIEIWARP
jgi:predicted enzyme related to lactoylglutathione lyase